MLTLETDGQMALNLGLLLMNVAGPDVLSAAVETLREEITVDAPPPPVPAPRDGRSHEGGGDPAELAGSNPDM